MHVVGEYPISSRLSVVADQVEVAAVGHVEESNSMAGRFTFFLDLTNGGLFHESQMIRTNDQSPYIGVTAGEIESVVLLQPVAVGSILIEWVIVDSVPVVRLKRCRTQRGEPSGSFPSVPLLEDASGLFQDCVQRGLVHVTRSQRIVEWIDDGVIGSIGFVTPLTDPGIVTSHCRMEPPSSFNNQYQLLTSFLANVRSRWDLIQLLPS